MSYAVFILKRAQKTLTKLPDQDYQRIRDKIRDLGYDPRPPGCKKLTGRPAWRIRIGVYRIIYEIDDSQQTITLHKQLQSLTSDIDGMFIANWLTKRWGDWETEKNQTQ